MPDVAEPPPPQRRGNGLLASYFVALADVDPRLGAHLLDLLRLADVPAYLEPAAPNRARGRSPRDRLYVAGSLRRTGPRRRRGSSATRPAVGSFPPLPRICWPA